MPRLYRDRKDAGLKLAAALEKYRGRRDAVVLAVPRGGLPVGAVLARELGLPLDAVMVKKIGHPEAPEVAVGAVGLRGEVISDAAERLGATSDYLEAQGRRLRAELNRRRALYCGCAAPVAVAGKTVLLTDDGVATGMTLAAAAAALTAAGAARVVIAVPVAPPDALDGLRARVDEIVCLSAPLDFHAVGQFYEDFDEVSDEQAVAILRASRPAKSIAEPGPIS